MHPKKGGFYFLEKHSMSQKSKITFILYLGIGCLFLGRAWLLFKKPSPITSFIYHPYLEIFWANLSNQSVETFLASTSFRAGEVFLAQGIAILFGLGILWTFFIKKLSNRWNLFFVCFFTGLLTFLAFCFFLQKSHQAVQFFELSLIHI